MQKYTHTHTSQIKKSTNYPKPKPKLPSLTESGLRESSSSLKAHESSSQARATGTSRAHHLFSAFAWYTEWPASASRTLFSGSWAEGKMAHLAKVVSPCLLLQTFRTQKKKQPVLLHRTNSSQNLPTGPHNTYCGLDRGTEYPLDSHKSRRTLPERR
jgi:hypothetical protein